MTGRKRSVSPTGSACLDHRWMSRAACTERLELPWTEDAHRVEAEIRDLMARVCRACPVRGYCRRYATQAHASAGFWAVDFRGGAYIGDLVDLLAELPDAELHAHYEPEARKARAVHRRALAS